VQGKKGAGTIGPRGEYLYGRPPYPGLRVSQAPGSGIQGSDGSRRRRYDPRGRIAHLEFKVFGKRLALFNLIQGRHLQIDDITPGKSFSGQNRADLLNQFHNQMQVSLSTTGMLGMGKSFMGMMKNNSSLVGGFSTSTVYLKWGNGLQKRHVSCVSIRVNYQG
jgi:hypothetical protein